ncbi:hypothetical protein V5F49_11255 [Xanthobacter sp. V3C-3]|uniref:hypothetical protein n=1 Tax=Xanthobacter lutulentifluminis TaxID=3119935 RepID=UPI00372836E8
MTATALSKAHRTALDWLHKHNGDGLFDTNGVVLAGGESAPFMRSTWNALRDAGLVEFYKPANKGRGRVRLTANGVVEARNRRDNAA